MAKNRNAKKIQRVLVFFCALAVFGLNTACSISADISHLNDLAPPSLMAKASTGTDVVAGSEFGEVTSGGYKVSGSMDMQSSAFYSQTSGGYKSWSSVQTSIDGGD